MPKKTPAKQATDREILELQIDAKLRAAIDGLRESNEAELERLVRDQHEPKHKRLLRNSGIIIALLILSNLAAWIGVKERIKAEADRVINNKLIDPQLTNTLDNALSNRAVPFIAQKVRPLESNVSVLATRTESLNKTIDVLSLDISNKQASLLLQQITITNQQHVQKLLIAAKDGSLAAYRELETLSRQAGVISGMAGGAVNEVALFFDTYRFGRSASLRSFLDTVSQEAIEEPLDWTVAYLADPSASQRETAANQLAKAAKENTVAHLCEAMLVETNLFVMASISRALGEISRKYFGPLDTASVSAWWNSHKQESRFQSPYHSALRYAKSLGVPPPEAKEAIELLTKTIEAEPLAWGARLTRANSYANLGDLDQAQKEIAAIENGFPGFGPKRGQTGDWNSSWAQGSRALAVLRWSWL